MMKAPSGHELFDTIDTLRGEKVKKVTPCNSFHACPSLDTAGSHHHGEIA